MASSDIILGLLNIGSVKLGTSDVKLCLGNKQVYPVKGDVVAKFNVTDTSNPTKVLNSTNNIKYVRIDGARQSSVETGYTLSAGEHTIEYELVNKTVGTSAFRECEAITSVEIGDGVTNIGENAFRACTNISSVTISDTVTTIGQASFRYCTGITNFTISTGVTSIANQAFYDCYGLTNVTIPNSVTSIGQESFKNCSGLTNCTLGTSVTTIGNGTFENCSGLTSITIPDGVSTIGQNLFKNCTSLSSCTLGSGVTTIGNWSFVNCSSLTSITMPSGVTTIGDYAFNGCSSLTSVNIPNGVTSIGIFSFDHCTSLTSITIPDSVTSLGHDAFNNCTSLSSCTIGNGITSINNSTFYNCISLSSVTIPSGVTSIGYQAFVYCSGLTSVNIPNGVTSIEYNTFLGCSSLTSIVIPSGVTSIGNSAFQGCSGLTSIEIPSGVTSIGNNVLRYCSGLTSITCNATTPPTLGTNAFQMTNNCPIYVPCDSVDTYKAANEWAAYASRIQAIVGSCPIVAEFNVTSTSEPTRIASATTNFSKVVIDGVEQPSVATGYTFSSTGNHTVKYYLTDPTNASNETFRGCSNITSIEMPDTITRIGDRSFHSCSGLTSINIPSGVTSIGSQAFENCSSLTSIEIPSGVTSINLAAFSNCTSLSSVTIPDSVTSFGNNAFWSCSNLTSIDIPSGVTSIGSSAFLGCRNLTSIDIPSGVTSISSYTFKNCSSLTSVGIPSGITSIGDESFTNCASLTSIDIPSGVTNIAQSAFAGCTSIRSINIPSGVTSITHHLFNGCTSLTSVTITDSVTSIGESAFLGCRSLISIDIPSGVTSIDGYAFKNCSSLTSIDIPSGVTSIGRDTFASCPNLTSATVNATTPPTLGSGAFDNTNNCPIYVPCESVDAYKAATNWSSYASRIQAIVGSCPIVAEFNVTSTSEPTRITYNINNFSKIEIDDVEQPSVATGYTFDTAGTHTVKYYLTNTSRIEGNAFANCSGITSVNIPDTVTEIGYRVFQNCTSLTSCTIGSGVTSIGNYAFLYCSSLTSIDIPDSVTSIGNYAFTYCTGLTSVDIPSGVTSIGEGICNYCSGLISILVNSGNTVYDSRNGCNAIIETSTNILVQGCKNTVIPNNVTSIGNFAFNGCSGLTSIVIPDSVTSIGGAFQYCTSLTSIVIPDGVTSIGNFAFNNCTSLTSCTIGSGVTSIGDGAFYNCSGLTSITIEATTPPTLGTNVLDKTNSCPIYVPCDSVDTYKAARDWSDYASRIQAIYAEPITNAVVTCDNATYNGAVQTAQNIAVTLSGETLVANTDYTVTSNTGGTNAGSYTVVVGGVGCYSGTSNGTFTIGKVTPTVTAPTAKVLTYNTQAQELVNAGSTDFGTLKYSLDNSTWSTSVPTATNYGSYTVYYKVDGDSNVNSVAAQSISCSINEKQVTATVELSQSTYTYNGSACQPTVTVKDGTVVIDPSEYTVTYSNNVNAGTATVTISDNVGGNYEVIGSTTFTINKVTPTVTAPTAKSVTYNGSSQALVNAASTNWGTLKYSTDGTNYSTAIPSGTTAGSYTVYYKVDGDSNINSVTAQSISVTIAKATGSVTTAPVNNNYTYNDTARAVASAGSGTGTMYYRLGTSGSFSTTIPTMTNAGSNTLYYYAAASTNYEQSSTGSITVSVQKASRTLSWSSAPSDLELGNTMTITAVPSAGSGDGAITYTSSNSSIVSVNGNTISGVSEGSCTITATIAAGTNYLGASVVSDTITVENQAKGHAYVEIAGTKWATMNIGANSVTDYGQYFQWGDTTGYLSSDVGSGSTAYKKPFSWNDYKFDNGSNGQTTGFTKYNANDSKTVLDLCDDAARLNWGGGWRMPTTDEYVALGNAVNTAWTASYQGSGVAGVVLTDKIDSSKVLFFPAAGYCSNGSVRYVGRYGYYWSSSLGADYGENYAYSMYFSSGLVGWDGSSLRFSGYPVRGVVG